MSYAASLHPLVWSQLHLLGGPRRLLGFAMGYTALLILGAVGFRALDPAQPIAAYCDSAISLLTGGQCLVIVLGGSNAVYRALLRDSTSNMLESHRLAPMGGLTVVSGYLLGATLQTLMIYLINMAFGVALIRLGTQGLASWVTGNICLLLVTPVLWSLTLLLGMSRKKPMSPMGILVIMAMLSGVLYFVPGLGLLSGFYGVGVSVGTMIGADPVPPPLLFAVVLASMFVAVLWSRAAIRMYLRPDLIPFDTLRALGVLLLWLAIGALALYAPRIEAVRTASPWAGEFSQDSGVREYLERTGTATLLMTLVLAVWPIAAAAKTKRRLVLGGRPFYRGDRISTHAATILAAVLVVLFAVWCCTEFFSQPRFVRLAVAIAVGAALFAVHGLLTRAYSLGERFSRAVVAYIVFFWIAPFCLVLWQEALDIRNHPLAIFPAWLGEISPFVTLANLTFSERDHNVVGLAVQVVLGAGCYLWGARALSGFVATRRKQSKKS